MTALLAWEKHATDTGQADFCFVDKEMTFSFDVELLQ